MKKLTEEMVVARTKISDLSKVKKLNCWGTELTDVSLVRKMPNVEVLSLSVNKLNNLSDFENCRSLQELYVRQNDIRDLNQVCYLQNLPNLKHLWLSENPCASSEGYRLAVIRALPQLQKLDNSAVVVEELSEALKRGRILIHPADGAEESDPQESYQQNYRQQSQPQQYQEQYYQQVSPNQSPPRQEPEYEIEETVEFYAEEEIKREIESPPRQQSPPRRQEVRRSYSPEPEPQQTYYEERRNGSYEQAPSRQEQYYDRSPIKETDVDESVSTQSVNSNSPKEQYHHPTHKETTLKIPISFSANSIKEYTNGDRHYHQQVQYERLRGERCEKSTCPANHRPPFNRRPVTRNSSILSAVLCLVKELDYASLEVVEMAVRCRMDELNEE